MFDHAIALVEIDGQRYWLDSTRGSQVGSLESLGFHDFSKALVIGRNSTRLTDVQPHKAYANSVQVTETFDVKSYRDPVDLKVESVFRGERAEWMRKDLYGCIPPRSGEACRSTRSGGHGSGQGTGDSSGADL